MINRVAIKNFKAIKNAVAHLTPIHLLIGPNDSGKTSVLEAIAAICRSVDHNSTNSFLGRWQGRELVHSATIDALVEISVEFVNGRQPMSYTTRAEFPSIGRQVIWQTATVTEDTGTTNILVSPDRTLPEYAGTHANHLAEAIKRPEWLIAHRVASAVAGCWYLRWTARNLALPTALNPERKFRLEGNGFGLPTLVDDLVSYDRHRFEEMESEFTKIFPHVRMISLVQQSGFNSPVDQSDDTLLLQPSPAKQIVFRLKNSDVDLPASQAAEGMLYILGYLALMYLPKPPRVLLIEEPENGMHPHRVGDIVRILRQLIARHPETQIVLTSHSPYLVDAFQPHEVTWCRRDEKGDVVLTRLDTIPEVERSLSVFSLGEIWTGELEPQRTVEDTP